MQREFHMGLPAGQSEQVHVTFTLISPTQTGVELVHSNWEGCGAMAEMMRNGYGKSWEMPFEEAPRGACQG